MDNLNLLFVKIILKYLFESFILLFIIKIMMFNNFNFYYFIFYVFIFALLLFIFDILIPELAILFKGGLGLAFSIYIFNLGTPKI
jgi:hypothetical protein